MGKWIYMGKVRNWQGSERVGPTQTAEPTSAGADSLSGWCSPSPNVFCNFYLGQVYENHHFISSWWLQPRGRRALKRTGRFPCRDLPWLESQPPSSLTSRSRRRAVSGQRRGAGVGDKLLKCRGAPITRQLSPGNPGPRPSRLSLGNLGKRQRDGIRTEVREFGCGFRC